MSDFEKFKQRFLYWQKKFGLTDWRILHFQEMPYENECPYARVNYIPSRHECWVYFWGDNDKRKSNIDEKAFHEVCHLLIGDLAAMSDKDTDKEEHVIINRLISVFETEFKEVF